MKIKTITRLLVLGGALCAGAATNVPPLKAAAPAKAVPAAKVASPAQDPLAPPQTLKTPDGRPETGLVDPFASPEERGSAHSDGTFSEEGFMRTSLGEISQDFRILGVVVPADTNLQATAVLQLNSKLDPVTVHPGDSVRIEGRDETQVRGRRVHAVAAKRAGTLDDKLKDYTFYLYIKAITVSHLEVYRNKKRPDETLILNW